MKRHRYHLTPHAKEETIPLRTGVIPKSNKVFLDEIEIDEEGTGQQTKGQRDAGKYHLLANVWLSEFGEDRLPGLWRLVTVEPDQDHLDPPIITLLPPDRSTARSEANLTDFLKKERQKNDKPWLTTEYIAATLHPLLKAGRLRDQNDLSNHLNAVMMEPVIAAKDAAERDRDLAEMERELAQQAKDSAELQSSKAQEAKDAAERDRVQAERDKQAALSQVAEANEQNKILIDELEQMRRALADIKDRSKIGADKDNSGDAARAVTRPWPSKTAGSNYMNIGIEATVVDVHQSGSNISLTYIDRHGNNQTVIDFGYRGFRQLVYDYLKSCRDAKQRAVFILTYKPDMRMKLAADTMELDTYVNLWRKKSHNA